MKLSFVILILLALNSSGQTITSCACKGFIELNSNESIKILDNPNGKLIKLIKYNAKTEDYLKVDIDKVSDSFFHAKLQYDMSGESFTGWFLKKKYLTTFVKNYSAPMKLYSLPIISSKISASISTGSEDLFEVQDCKDKWVFVAARSKNKLYSKKGWLQSQNQCANPYTTCN